MLLEKIKIDKNTFLLTYKLLHDALFLALLTLAGILVADGLLPGLLTNKISFTKIILIVIILIFTIIYLGKNLEIVYFQTKANESKILPALILFAFLLIGNSMLKFTLWENIVITLTTLLTFFLFYELIFHAEAE